MAQPTNHFNSLAGTPTHYARLPVAPYGTRGKPHTFYAIDSFQSQADACFAELWTACPLGQAEVLTSAGFYVDKAGKHGEGRAMDLDALFWPGKDFVTNNFPSDQKFYLAVESILRKYFGTVLDYLYNADHHDHFHIDDGSPVGFQPGSESRVKYVQAALTYVWGTPTPIKGAYDAATKAAVVAVLTALGLLGQNIEDKDLWLAFLTATASKGFAP